VPLNAGITGRSTIASQSMFLYERRLVDEGLGTHFRRRHGSQEIGGLFRFPALALSMSSEAVRMVPRALLSIV
jgi:hypothetical protein